ncbi:MAG: TonB-dependent receptor [Saprospiraceae bacterium]|nr:TonB-dependent receptor [Saprospiraceae bacterium]HPG07214.1 TonB-dependent receptor [Saprospiraceae bacterium]
MKKFCTSILLLVFTTSMGLLTAQVPFGGRTQGPTITGKISGVLQDSTAQTMVEFATVSVLKAGSDKVVNGTVSEDGGVFKVIELALGKYDVQLSFIGYTTKTIKNIELTPDKPDVDLGTILMSSDQLMLDEVEVVGQAAIVENKVDRIVYNADKDPSTAGGDATDVLRKVPLLSVDMDGNVSLRGSSNLQILINGKPSGMFSSNVGDALRMIPSDQIKNVEVITTPGAKYDAEGTGGIINIITKKKTIDGFSGSLNGSLGNIQNNGGLNFNFARGRFGLNGGGGTFFSWPQDGPSSFYREDYLENSVRTLSQVGNSTTQRIGFRGTAGAFYDFNAYNSINTSFNLRGFSFNRDGYQDAVFSDPSANFIQNYRRTTDGSNGRDGFDWNTDYKKTFKNPGQEFTLAFQLSGENSNNNSQLGTTYENGGTDLLQKTFNDGVNREYTLQSDYTHPFGEKYKLETGAKAVFRHINSDSRYSNFDYTLSEYVTDPQRSNILLYDQDVYAGYGSLTINFNAAYSMVAGLRYEHTSIAGDLKQGETTFTNQYDNFVPSLIVSRKFKNFSTLKVSYARRIQRPSLEFINPFQDISDPLNISYGNPDLNPELSDQYDLGYTAFLKGSVLNSSIYYRRTKDVIERYLTIDAEGIASTSFQNLGLSENYGLNVFGSFPITKFWTLRSSIDVNYLNITSNLGGESVSNQGMQYRIFGNTSFKLKKDWQIEAFGFFNSPRFTLQGTFPSFSMYSIGISKEFLNKRASLGIRAVSPFQKYLNFKTELSGATFTQTSNFSMPFRSVGVTFRYSFGKLDFKARERGSSIKNDDLKSGGDNNQMGGNNTQQRK